MPKKMCMPMKKPLKAAPLFAAVGVLSDVSTPLLEPFNIAQAYKKMYTSWWQASGELVGRHKMEEYVTHFTAAGVLRTVSMTQKEPYTIHTAR